MHLLLRAALHTSRAYVKHYSKPPTISQAALQSLAMPKEGMTHHGDTRLALQSGDLSQYAKQKAMRLQQQRERKEGMQQLEEHVREQQREQLERFMGWKSRRQALKASVAACEAQAAKVYGARLAAYLSAKGEREVQALVEARRAGAATATPSAAQTAIQAATTRGWV
jgi:hypothetical protein